MQTVDVAQLVTSGTAVVALGAAVWQVRSSRLQAQDATTHAYIATLSEASFTKHLARSMDALHLEAATEQAIAARWRRFHLNRRIVEQQLEHTAAVVYERIAWWIAQVQADDSGYFHEWELMLGWFAERRLRSAWHTSRP